MSGRPPAARREVRLQLLAAAGAPPPAEGAEGACSCNSSRLQSPPPTSSSLSSFAPASPPDPFSSSSSPRRPQRRFLQGRQEAGGIAWRRDDAREQGRGRVPPPPSPTLMRARFATPAASPWRRRVLYGVGEGGACRMDLPGPTTLVGTRTDYSVGPWDYLTCAPRYLMA
jgi:hypothetical protein